MRDGEEGRETNRLERFVQRQASPAQTLETLDEKELRSRLVQLRGKRRTHAARAGVLTLPLLFTAFRGIPLEGPILAMLAPVALAVVFDVWRAVSAQRELRDMHLSERNRSGL